VVPGYRGRATTVPVYRKMPVSGTGRGLPFAHVVCYRYGSTGGRLPVVVQGKSYYCRTGTVGTGRKNVMVQRVCCHKY
jgi:hypothetical protein